MENDNFDKWIFEVVKYLHLKNPKLDETEIYSNLDLTYCKLSYLDGIKPINYTTW